MGILRTADAWQASASDPRPSRRKQIGARDGMRATVCRISMKSCFLLLCACAILSGALAASRPPAAFEIRLAGPAAAPDTEDLTVTNDVTKAEEVLHVRKIPILDGAAIRSFSIQTYSGAKRYFVEVVFTEQGRATFAETTRSNIGKRLAILVDGRVVIAPKIMEEMKDGKVWIDGGYSQQEATDLAVRLNKSLGLFSESRH
jgi:hypothetical protein